MDRRREYVIEEKRHKKISLNTPMKNTSNLSLASPLNSPTPNLSLNQFVSATPGVGSKISFQGALSPIFANRKNSEAMAFGGGLKAMLPKTTKNAGSMLPSINDAQAQSGFFITDIADIPVGARSPKDMNNKKSPQQMMDRDNSTSTRNLLDKLQTFENKSSIPFSQMLDHEREKAVKKNTRS